MIRFNENENDNGKIDHKRDKYTKHGCFFQAFKIVKMVPNHAKHHIYKKACISRMISYGSLKKFSNPCQT